MTPYSGCFRKPLDSGGAWAIRGAFRRDTHLMRSETEGASELNRELTQMLASVGEELGFRVVQEYPVKGGRLDVVWTWAPPPNVPGLHTAIPVVGFEIESSWRTRKHVKGDLLNLQDAGVALGVIVLAGEGAGDESLRRFAVALVDRPGATVLIWTAADVHALAHQVASDPIHPSRIGNAEKSESPQGVEAEPGSSVATPSVGSTLAHASRARKYAPLHRWLRTQDASAIPMTFADVEEVLGFPLPASCRNHVPHWHSYDGSAVARAIIDAGWKASRVDLREQTLTLVRLQP